MNENDIAYPPPKSVFILNFLIFNGLFGFVFLYAWYTKIIPVEELAKFLTAFPTLIALVFNVTIPTVLYRMFINVLKTYKTDVGGVDKANKVLALYSKLSLLAPIILTLATPIATLLWLGIHSIEKIIACVLGAVGCLNFASLFFYILWTHKLEAYLKFLPFEKKHITMSYILRNMMVSFFLFGALIFLCIDPFIGMLYNGLTLIQTLKMIIPIAILTLSVALFINYTLYKGVNNSINEVMNFTDTLAVGNFIVDKLEIKRRDVFGILAMQLNIFHKNTVALLSSIKNNTNTMNEVGTILSTNAEETASSIHQISENINGVKQQTMTQAAGVTETAATMEEIIRTIKQLNGSIEMQAASVARSSSSIEEMVANIASITDH